MGRPFRGVAAVVVTLALASTTAAHHSPAVFDLRKEVTLTGVITALQFRNPHLFFHVAVTDGTDLEGEWEVEAQSPRIMTLYGWSSKSLARGDRVVVVVNPPQQRPDGWPLPIGPETRWHDAASPVGVQGDSTAAA
jgi:hypothetical protein